MRVTVIVLQLGDSIYFDLLALSPAKRNSLTFWYWLFDAVAQKGDKSLLSRVHWLKIVTRTHLIINFVLCWLKRLGNVRKQKAWLASPILLATYKPESPTRLSFSYITFWSHSYVYCFSHTVLLSACQAYLASFYIMVFTGGFSLWNAYPSQLLLADFFWPFRYQPLSPSQLKYPLTSLSPSVPLFCLDFLQSLIFSSLPFWDSNYVLDRTVKCVPQSSYDLFSVFLPEITLCISFLVWVLSSLCISQCSSPLSILRNLIALLSALGGYCGEWTKQ